MEKIDIQTRNGLDRLIDLSLDESGEVILADMGAGSYALRLATSALKLFEGTSELHLSEKATKLRPQSGVQIKT
ncbi:MAG TPA: hypothetical protein VIS96_01330 [Terrimicrobiaceae bacterium]